MSDDHKDPETDTESRRVGLSGAWIAIGAGIGVALGAAIDNIGIGLAIGVAIGVVVMAAQNAYSKKN